jgi:hypothetical protein
MADYNGDLKLVAYQIGELTGKIGSLDGKLETNIAVHNDRLREAEKQSALQEQSMKAVCKKIEDLDGDVKDLDSDIKRSNLVSKIIGGIAGGLAVLAAAIGISK